MFLGKLITILSGWTGALALVVIYLASEFGSVAIAGDRGSFLYVSLHFILNPILSLIVIVFTLIEMSKPSKMLEMIYQGISIIIPALIIYIAITGNTFFIKLLGITFNN